MLEYNGTNAKDVIEDLRKKQWQEYEYTEFIQVLKTRLRRYKGNSEVMFYSEDQIAEILWELEREGREDKD